MRKNPVNFGIIFEDSVLYSSDMEIAPVLDLAKFSISFTNNLVRNAELLRFTHEPRSRNIAGDGTGVDPDLLTITREHVLFKFMENKRGERITICMTFASADDLRALGIAYVTPQQLMAQAQSLLDAYTQAFIEATNFDEISFKELSQAEFLKFHQTTIELYSEIKRIIGIVFEDTFPYHGLLERGRVSTGDCKFLFSAVMHGSVPVATKFYADMKDFFKIRANVEKGNINSVIENLVSAQLSTIISTATSLASTMMRQVEVRLTGPKDAEKLYIGFYPVKGQFAIVFICTGDPSTLLFFTQATAAVLMEMPVLDEKFTGELTMFEPIQVFINDIPPTIEQQREENLETLVEDMDLDIIVGEEERHKMRQDAIDAWVPDEDDPKDAAFNKIRKQVLNKQTAINDLIIERKLKPAMKKTRSILDQALKVDAIILARYYGRKLSLLVDAVD
ncbi:hypothetical protein GF325_10185 [Candidatus Bathyarchaeota archaeon]|nr:hypothetical protein [Candidatus Bathyarchaeota archaeon]